MYTLKNRTYENSFQDKLLVLKIISQCTSLSICDIQRI